MLWMAIAIVIYAVLGNFKDLYNIRFEGTLVGAIKRGRFRYRGLLYEIKEVRYVKLCSAF